MDDSRVQTVPITKRALLGFGSTFNQTQMTINYILTWFLICKVICPVKGHDRTPSLDPCITCRNRPRNSSPLLMWTLHRSTTYCSDSSVGNMKNSFRKLFFKACSDETSSNEFRKTKFAQNKCKMFITVTKLQG